MTKKLPWFLKLAHPYVARRLRRQFADVRLLGGDELRGCVAEGPIILACNHVAWWDPLLLVHLDSVLGSDGYCLMDKHNLDQLPFFGWVGALPLDRTDRKSSYQDLRRSTQVLDAPGRILAIFPHGEQRPPHLSLGFRSGVATLARVTKAPVLPVAIRYDYLEGPRQVVHISVGSPISYSIENHSRQSFVIELEGAVGVQLDRIDAQLLAPSPDVESLIHSKARSMDRERIPLPATALRALTGGASHD